MAGIGGGDAPGDGRTRYQLVDTGAMGGDVPVLRSPGQLRRERVERRGESVKEGIESKE